MKKKNKLLVTIIVLIMVVGLIMAYYLYSVESKEDLEDYGKNYINKSTLCQQFAQSYLRTIPNTEPDFNNDKWQMAVDVETDLYNLCLVDLNKEALENYKTSALEKYQK